ncbi:hypothetical protein CL629_02775 [bacterium]|nr:hypothetical protein [bacterium]|tara:strand:- start:161 stop:409 length:249 start_codon:yes stop_codon:yes gene_type:complete
MPKDPSFDRYLDEQIEEHSKDEPHDEYCEEEGCAECEEEGGSMPNGISILNTTVCRNLNLPPTDMLEIGTWKEEDDKPWGQG